ncbi:unnamed protein product [Owenia fusiformis]|uniref:Uncharacterized protein n=1 Tax=Owenia fusiformis TaxID=6347 RepID=A0A8S4Q5B0_OWEFU|nr:unnamed protein product [Owenia fusiformis]
MAHCITISQEEFSTEKEMEQQNNTVAYGVVKGTTTFLWQRKMKTYFDAVVIGHPGKYITRSHYEEIIYRIKTRYKGLSKRAIEIINRVFLQILWGEPVTRGGDVGKNRKVSLTEFTRNAAENLKPENIGTFIEVLDYISASLFWFIDVDKDKDISLDEFNEFFILFGIPHQFSQNAFESIDADDSGQNALIRHFR